LKYSGCGAIGSALALGARGCQFESGHPDHFFKGFVMIPIRIFFLSCIFTASFSMIANTANSSHLEEWQTHLNRMTPQELQITANMLYLLLANSVAEWQIRKFATPIARLQQSIRTNIAEYKNATEDLAMLKTLIDRLSYVASTRTIYNQTLATCLNYHNQNTIQIVESALAILQIDGQEQLRAWANDKTQETAQQLKKCSETIADSIQHFQGISRLHKGMSEGLMPIKIPQEDEKNKSLITLSIVLKNNPELFTVAENVIHSLNETSDHAAQIINAGIETYKEYYVLLHTMLMAPSFDKQYATTLFSMHGALPDEYKSLLPDTDHVFEHMLQTVKLYTQTEVSPS
jgi:hypothetical protein